MARYVTDTHSLIWYSEGRVRKLGRRARKAFEQAESGTALIHVPVLVLVEILSRVRAGHLRLASPAVEWVRGLFELGGFVEADLTTEVVLVSHGLYAIPERGDRLIAATAVALGHPLITRDPAIAKAGIPVVW